MTAEQLDGNLASPENSFWRQKDFCIFKSKQSRFQQRILRTLCRKARLCCAQGSHECDDTLMHRAAVSMYHF